MTTSDDEIAHGLNVLRLLEEQRDAERALADDLADVLSHIVVGWEPIIGHDLALHPSVVQSDGPLSGGESMSDRPKWTKAIQFFLGDTVMDDKYEWPDDGSADELLEEIEASVNAILCRYYGHQIEDDMCMKPEHRYCVVGADGGPVPSPDDKHFVVRVTQHAPD